MWLILKKFNVQREKKKKTLKGQHFKKKAKMLIFTQKGGIPLKDDREISMLE